MNEKDIHLSRRERQIMDIIYRLGSATAAEVRERLPEAPSYSAVRALLRILEEKGHLRHRVEGQRYVYVPTLNRTKARRSAVTHVLQTFFNGSVEQAMAALLDVSRDRLSDEELENVARMIEEARKEGR